MIRDPALLAAVRAEVTSALVPDPTGDGPPTIDARAMLTLPLLQSLYLEAMRVHVSINITREVVGGGGIWLEDEAGGRGKRYRVSKGALLQAPSLVAQMDESVWGRGEGEREGWRPASEFWAERHVVCVQTEGGEKRREFSMAGRPSSFIPYGTRSLCSLLHSFPPCQLAEDCLPVTDRTLATLTTNWRGRWRHIHVSRPALCQAGNHARRCYRGL